MEELRQSAKEYLEFLCNSIDNRCVGSKGNLKATDYFKKQLLKNHWRMEQQDFSAFDWESEGAVLETADMKMYVQSSPYSEPCNLEAETTIVSSVAELETVSTKNKILIVKGELTREQLMPKNFVFYNPDHHKKIVSLLENSGALALVFVVGKEGFYEGGEYPYPIIEDGDFLLPSVFISEEEGERLLSANHRYLKLISGTRKTPSKGYNIIGRKGNDSGKKIVITAHIDAKKGSPGAIDNATGVVTLILLSELLKDYSGSYQIELVAFNGEDYYSVPGQMTYISKRQGSFDDIAFNINIDGVGFHKGETSYALMELPDEQKRFARTVLNNFPGTVEGEPWVQGDHSIFLQFGVPAIAISSDWLLNNLESQQITHTERDNPGIVDVDKVTELAEALAVYVKELS